MRLDRKLILLLLLALALLSGVYWSSRPFRAAALDFREQKGDSARPAARAVENAVTFFREGGIRNAREWLLPMDDASLRGLAGSLAGLQAPDFSRARVQKSVGEPETFLVEVPDGDGRWRFAVYRYHDQLRVAAASRLE